MDPRDNIREGLRVPLHNVSGQFADKGEVFPCEVVDISFSGVGLKVNNILPEGETIDIRFSLEGYGKVYCKAKVVSARGGRIGVNFINIPEKSKKHIQKFIENFTNENINQIIKNKPK
jgi:c-di-GMP-binding flagellar brake protein YcgR